MFLLFLFDFSFWSFCLFPLFFFFVFFFSFFFLLIFLIIFFVFFSVFVSFLFSVCPFFSVFYSFSFFFVFSVCLFFFVFFSKSCFFFLFSFKDKTNMLGFLTLAMVKGGSTRDAFTQKVDNDTTQAAEYPVG